MIIEWAEVTDSERVSAVAYVAEQQWICVRFVKDGVEWCYEGCSADEFEQFCAPGQSKGKFIHDVLNAKLHHKLIY
jgi:hypothetical protein